MKDQKFKTTAMIEHDLKVHHAKLLWNQHLGLFYIGVGIGVIYGVFFA